MKVCLISASTANQLGNRAVGEVDAARIMGELAPVGILSLAAVLEEKGLQPEVVDLNRVYFEWLQSSHQQERTREADFCRFAGSWFTDRQFDFFGLSTVCSSYPLTIRFAGELKRLHPESTVALGGPQASVVDLPTMRAYPFIDLVVRGEAEQTLPQLLDALDSGSSMVSVPGVTFRQGGEVLRTPDAPLILDLDSLPFPAFHLFPDVRFCRHFPMELGRGCPFACTFCSTNDFFRRRFRLKSPEHVIAEMRRVKHTYGINSFELVHDMFTVDRKRVVAFCEALLACDEKFYWGSSARTDCIDEELIELMASAGCRGIFFGIESGSAQMQKIIDKGLDLNESAARIQYCDKFKINTAVSLIAGFPDETMDDLQDTAAFFMDSLRHDHADPQLSILSPLADTPIQKHHKASLVLDDDIADMSYRGWNQEHEDYEMIAAHPEIFSSFYSVPTPFVKREFLKEFRDFV
ncbi:MAG TPA: radical SAM protein, partial [Candidatus Angelobacter sp.]|nr:radical SAM protein [Candidatus Angelobacter sp.]